MTTECESGLSWVPDACTLPTAEQPLRLAEFDELFAMVEQVDRIGSSRLRLALAGSASLVGAVRDLAERENACCSFFHFTITKPQPGRVLFDIDVPPTQADLLDALARRVASPGVRR
ncbi:hypothetical protein F4553_001438 [Allocatelliglobosispora scoriae]|uniref:Arsenate reductase n=1 Tax=Allocatelliglobosispora scoriae TaxID=643052 RepID=A0A841BLI3_9ACTN|nr:hypothetical protein [Allocatelliglobosispora scoriae]MBB5868059.1 hypothetical protein [Allocatelliglobosispora scoriae]